MERVSNPVSEIDRWFNSEVIRWRRFAAVVWTTLVTSPIVYATIAVANINPFHLLNWITESLLFVCTAWTWSYVVVSMLTLLLLSRLIGNTLMVVPVIHVNRWEKIVNILHPRCLYFVFSFGIMCSIITWCYVRLVAGVYHSLSSPCSHHSSRICLNEHHLFIVLHGFYVGFVYSFTGRLTRQNYVVFPIIQQSKFFQMKSSILSLMLTSIYVTLSRLRYFYVLYYLLLGSAIKGFLAKKFDLSQSHDEAAINSLSGMLDASLLWHCALSGSLLHFLLSLTTKIHKLYHTEWYHFPVETSVEQYKNLCLHNALCCERNSLIQYHSYQDLYLLSRHSLHRRLQLFSLTHLGGHPQNWIQVSKECLHLLTTFTEELATYNNKIMANGNITYVGSEKNALTFGLELGRYLFISPILSIIEDIKSEDKFGVVQKSLPQIIESILMLQEQVEKHLRLVPNISKHFDRGNNKASDLPLRGALKITMKTAMYRIVDRFGEHIKSVPLSGEHQRYLKNFIDYKE
ncbi:hypothetical protein LSH36_310g03032 [Paralvinella palmiformis]|uniref:Nucleoporin NDC1 n=1 Tax=Paralvinella palmiformis TaxID=53620 RepID=A0AAD9JH21_9ANNE|nr:hypothetical protein LSH36_310g03032 [Paralvinella palmiformis]